jgi:HNH endonuclease
MARIWTEAEKEIMRQEYPVNWASDMAAKLGRTVRSVYACALSMKIKKCPIWMATVFKANQNARLAAIGPKNQFKKGHPPFNKGCKLNPEHYEKMSKTFFKKGHTPKNLQHEGHERVSVDGYIEVRIRAGKYALKHRVVWEQHHGKIPPKMNIVFKDGNKMNTDISNLEMITRKELMARNTIARFPPELHSTIKILHSLKKNINEKQNQ